MTGYEPKVGDRVSVRLDFTDRAGTVTRYARRGRVVVVTDSGDAREYDPSDVKPLER